MATRNRTAPAGAPSCSEAPDPALLESAIKILRLAIGDGEQPDDAELDRIAEGATLVMFRLTDWLDAACSASPDNEPDASPAFDALDGVTFVLEAVRAGVNPTSSKTISPLKGTLRLCMKRLETELEAQDAAPAPSTELPRALSDYLDGQQRRVYELQDMLEQLDADEDLPACLGIAAREAHAINEALDANSIRHVLRGEQS